MIRIAVELVVDLLGRGYTAEHVLERYDHLAAEDVQACLAYAGEDLAARRRAGCGCSCGDPVGELCAEAPNCCGSPCGKGVDRLRVSASAADGKTWTACWEAVDRLWKRPRLRDGDQEAARVAATMASAPRMSPPPVSVCRPGVSPNAAYAKAVARTGSPRRNNPTTGADSDLRERLTSP
jgi:hypothetical protein